MKRFAALGRTIVGGKHFSVMLGLTFTAMQVSEAGPAIAFSVFGTVEFGGSEAAVLAEHSLRTPLLEIHVNILGIILPLVLLGVSYQILMGKDCQLLLS